jgi:hypothetical protein
VFCQIIRIAGVGNAKLLVAMEPAVKAADGNLVLIGPATGPCALKGPATGPCRLIGPAAGIAAPRENARGAVGCESVQERSPKVEASPKTTVSRTRARINAYRIEGRQSSRSSASRAIEILSLRFMDGCACPVLPRSELLLPLDEDA